MSRVAGFILAFIACFRGYSLSATDLVDQPQTFPWTVGLTPSGLSEAGGLAPGQSRWQLSTLWFNTYREATRDDSVLQRVDMEGILPMASVAWSWTEGWEVRAQIQSWLLGGGVMDAWISGFHDGIHVANQGRERVPNTQYRDLLQGQFDVTQPGAGLTEASAGIRGFFGSWSWWTWVKPPLPTASIDWGWTSSWGGGSSLGWGDRWPSLWGDWQLGWGANAALILIADDAAFPTQNRFVTAQGGGYLTFGPPSWGRFVLEGTATAVPRDGDAYLSQAAGILTFGWQETRAQEWNWSFTMTEEFLTWATMEVGFQVGVTWNPSP